MLKHHILARRELVFAASLTHMLAVSLGAQTEPTQGIPRSPPRVHALVGGRIVARPGVVIERGTVVIRDGVIEAAGADATVPPDARVWDMKGFTITAGFIDLDLRVKPRDDPPETSSQGLGWNRKVRPERDIAEGLTLDGETVRKHHAAGFTTALVCPDGGILSGDGALVSLRPDGDRRSVIAARVAACAGLDLSRGSGREYPASLMGAIALLRQTLLDAIWYREAWSHHLARPQSTERPELNLSLEALDPVVRQRRPIAMRAANVFHLLALRRVAEEFRLDAWYLGSGQEYQWLHLLEGSGIRLVIPLAFPPPPAVRRPEDAARVSLQDLEEWARSPESPARLALAGIAFAVTPRGLKSTGDFPAALRKAVDRGLPRDAAIAALTTVPAGFLGLESRLGTVEAGKVASLAVFVEEPLTAEAHVREVWVEGERHPVESRPAPDIRGQWRVELSAPGQALDRLEVTIAGERRKPSAKLKRGGEEPRRAMLEVDGPEVELSFPGEALGRPGFVRLGGVVSSPGEIRGAGLLGDGTAVELHAVRTAEREPRQDDGRLAKRWLGTQKEKLPVPLEARGRTEPALFPDALLVRGGTLWTCGPDGSFVGDLLVQRGRIEAVGSGLQAPPGAFVIDASGKHVTPGIIDAHSHTAIAGGVNEGTQAITAEVRIGDVIRADDINLYRQLAGGVTCAHLLHGSANPIGGQSAIIKLRWGEAPEGLKLAGAFPTIKFALGENVKQSNSSGSSSTRYPQTRMGVEQIMRQAFTAARRNLEDQRQARDRPIAELAAVPRRDLELEAIGEVLEGKRLVHCHSYRQDEILMMIRLAEEFGFHVGTFQHVLEGYKVAPEIARHGAGASTFSDWWAYKFEVYDAIPYNGALLHRAGVVTSFNSDSSELARRLNLEAAKAVKYGGVSRQEALAFVTLNPARQLRIDDRVGSLTRGKDADFVIWSGDPLSTYSVCLETWIEGKRMFSQDEDRRLEERDAARRRELIHRVLEESQGEKDQDESDRKPPGSPITVPAGGRP